MSDSYKTAWSFAGNVAHVKWLGKFSDYNLVRLYFPGGGGGILCTNSNGCSIEII